MEMSNVLRKARSGKLISSQLYLPVLSPEVQDHEQRWNFQSSVKQRQLLPSCTKSSVHGILHLPSYHGGGTSVYTGLLIKALSMFLHRSPRELDPLHSQTGTSQPRPVMSMSLDPEN